jgi:hypothetical protein
MKISKKIIIVILLIIIIGIIIGSYFLFFDKKSSNNESSLIPAATILPNTPNTVGFCQSATFDGVDQPKRFRSVEDIAISTKVLDTADIGTVISNGIQYKWVYDSTNSLNISRELTNASNAYSSAELSALGKTDKPGTYLVNKIITLYDKNDPKYKTGFYNLNPYIMTTFSNCK